MCHAVGQSLSFFSVTKNYLNKLQMKEEENDFFPCRAKTAKFTFELPQKKKTVRSETPDKTRVK